LFVVVSQRPEFNRGWTRVLAKWGDARPTTSLPNGQLALREKPASLVVVDSGLLDVTRPALIQELRTQCGAARLLLGDTSLAPLEELAALAAGAVACCDAALPREDLERIVGIVLHGGVWVSQATIPLLVSKLQAFSARPEPPAAPTTDRLEGLTQRQRAVAEMVGQGANNKQIARALDITDRTVKAHLTTIFEKLEISDRLQLALYITNRKDL
jgi:two-component system, NarL family, nitrate/nitrite response regulator NarL